jgi:hypothetical protein
MNKEVYSGVDRSTTKVSFSRRVEWMKEMLQSSNESVRTASSASACSHSVTRDAFINRVERFQKMLDGTSASRTSHGSKSSIIDLSTSNSCLSENCFCYPRTLPTLVMHKNNNTSYPITLEEHETSTSSDDDDVQSVNDYNSDVNYDLEEEEADEDFYFDLAEAERKPIKSLTSDDKLKARAYSTNLESLQVLIHYTKDIRLFIHFQNVLYSHLDARRNACRRIAAVDALWER